MQTVTKVKSKVKQKVVLAIGVVALLAGFSGFISTLGHARGFGFGWPFVRRPYIGAKKTMLPAYDDSLCRIRTSTGGTIKVPCKNLKKTKSE